MSRVLLVVCVVLLLCAHANSDIGGWMPVGAHYHSDFSDGTSSIDEATEYMLSGGNRYALLADHAEMISRTTPLTHQSHKSSGYGPWLATTMGIDGCVPGLECGLGPSHGSHLLYYGGLSSIIGAACITESSGENDPDRAFRIIRECANDSGAVLIAAHPTCVAYPFRVLNADIDGIEVFDSFGKDAATDLYFLKDLKVARSKPMAIVTGSDYHGPDVSRLNAVGKYVAGTGNFTTATYAPWNLRRTYVDCSSKHQIVQAIKSGRCYAAFADARITSASVCPGDKIEATQSIEIDYTGVPIGPGIGNVIFAMGRSGANHQQNSVTDHFDGTFRFDPTTLPPPVLKDGCYLYILIGKVIATSAIEILPYNKPKEQKEPSAFDRIASALIDGLVVGIIQGSDSFDLSIGPGGASLVPVPPSSRNNSSGPRPGQGSFIDELLSGSPFGSGGARTSSEGIPSGSGVRANTAAAAGGSGSGGPVSPFFVAPVSPGGAKRQQPAPTCAPVTVSGSGINAEDGVSVVLTFSRLADTGGRVSMTLRGIDGRTITYQNTRPFGGTGYTAAGFSTGYGWVYQSDMGSLETNEGRAQVVCLVVKGSINKGGRAVSGAVVYYKVNGTERQVNCKFP